MTGWKLQNLQGALKSRVLNHGWAQWSSHKFGTDFNVLINWLIFPWTDYTNCQNVSWFCDKRLYESIYVSMIKFDLNVRHIFWAIAALTCDLDLVSPILCDTLQFLISRECDVPPGPTRIFLVENYYIFKSQLCLLFDSLEIFCFLVIFFQNHSHNLSQILFK